MGTPYVTYNMDSYPHMWESLEQCMALFREASADVARRMDYQYPPYDEKISNYVIRQKEKYGMEDEKAQNTFVRHTSLL